MWWVVWLLLAWMEFRSIQLNDSKIKDKALPYLLPSVGPGADPGIQEVSPQFSLSHFPGSIILQPVLSYTAWWQMHIGVLAQGCYAALSRCELNPRPIDYMSNTLLLLLLAPPEKYKQMLTLCSCCLINRHLFQWYTAINTDFVDVVYL